MVVDGGVGGRVGEKGFEKGELLPENRTLYLLLEKKSSTLC